MSKRRRKERRDESRRGELNRASMTPEQVQAELMDGVTVSSLIELGVLTARGGASPSARRKVKQVNHLLNQLNAALTDLFERHEDPVIVDMGAGRATASLALYDRWIRPRGKGRLLAIESRGELADKVREKTQGLYPRLEVISGEALSAPLPERVHLVFGLHACDLASDHAIARAIRGRADYIALVPCCQAEVARALKSASAHLKQSDQADTTEGALALTSLWGASHHRREFGAHLTNVCRCLVLRSAGYAVSTTELIGWEHSMKNELILGRRVARFHRGAKRELASLLSQLGLVESQEEQITSLAHTPWLISQLDELIKLRDDEGSRKVGGDQDSEV